MKHAHDGPGPFPCALPIPPQSSRPPNPHRRPQSSQRPQLLGARARAAALAAARLEVLGAAAVAEAAGAGARLDRDHGQGLGDVDAGALLVVLVLLAGRRVAALLVHGVGVAPRGDLGPHAVRAAGVARRGGPRVDGGAGPAGAEGGLLRAAPAGEAPGRGLGRAVDRPAAAAAAPREGRGDEGGDAAREQRAHGHEAGRGDGHDQLDHRPQLGDHEVEAGVEIPHR